VATTRSDDPLVLPEYGPTLPALLRARAGLPTGVTIALVAGLVALAGLAAVAVRPGDDDGDQLIYEGEPVFNVLYVSDALHREPARPGELLRLEGRRGPQSATVTVRPLGLPDFAGDVSHAQLPAYATAHIDALRARFDGFQLIDEGRARVNDAPGYEVTFRSGPPQARTFGSDVLVVPSEDVSDGAVVISLRRHVTGPLDEADKEFSGLARKAFRSFRYGRDRG
jgi:hypothetical protein